MPLDLLATWCQTHGLPLSESQLEAFETFQNHLYQVNESVNFTRVPKEECEERHFIDSLLIAPFIPQEAKVLDIGTGPGFPSWVLACARPDLKVVAVDGSEKAFPFLNAHTLENLVLVKCRAEEFGSRERFDIVTGRALAPFSLQIEVSAAWAKIGGLVIPFRMPSEEEEIQNFPCAQLGLTLEEVVELELPSGAARLFPLFRKTKVTPKDFPRPWARMKTRPLGKKPLPESALSSPEHLGTED